MNTLFRWALRDLAFYMRIADAGLAHLRASIWHGGLTQIIKVPAATPSGSSTFTCGKLAKSLPLKVRRYSSRCAAMNAACRASWVRLPLMSWSRTSSSQRGKTSRRSIRKGYELVSCSISCSDLAVLHPRPLASLGRVTTAQYSIRTCGLRQTQCPCRTSALRDSTAAVCCFASGSAARSQTFVSASTRIISRRCFRGLQPNLTSQRLQRGFWPSHQSWRPAQKDSCASIVRESQDKDRPRRLLALSPQTLLPSIVRGKNSMDGPAEDAWRLQRSRWPQALLS